LRVLALAAQSAEPRLDAPLFRSFSHPPPSDHDPHAVLQDPRRPRVRLVPGLARLQEAPDDVLDALGGRVLGLRALDPQPHEVPSTSRLEHDRGLPTSPSSSQAIRSHSDPPAALQALDR